jgi:hypothetical protein
MKKIGLIGTTVNAEAIEYYKNIADLIAKQTIEFNFNAHSLQSFF